MEAACRWENGRVRRILTRRTMGFLKPQLEKDGFKEEPLGVNDLRDWDEIRSWARELAVKATNE